MSRKSKVDPALLDKITSRMKASDTVADCWKLDITPAKISCLKYHPLSSLPQPF
jgi:hypothetical protein